MRSWNPEKKFLINLLRPWLLMTCIRPGGVGWVIQDNPLAMFSFWPKGSEYNLFHFASFAFYGESYGFNRNWQVGKNSFKSLRSLDDTLFRSSFDSRALQATILHEMDHGCVSALLSVQTSGIRSDHIAHLGQHCPMSQNVTLIQENWSSAIQHFYLRPSIVCTLVRTLGSISLHSS